MTVNLVSLNDIKVGWSWWTAIRLWFCKPIIGVDGDYYCITKRLDGKVYIVKSGKFNPPSSRGKG